MMDRDYNSFYAWLHNGGVDVDIFDLERPNKYFIGAEENYRFWSDSLDERLKRDGIIESLTQLDYDSIVNLIEVKMHQDAFYRFMEDVDNYYRMLGVFEMINRWKLDFPQSLSRFYVIPSHFYEGDDFIKKCSGQLSALKNDVLSSSHCENQVLIDFIDSINVVDIARFKSLFFPYNKSLINWIEGLSDLNYFTNDWSRYLQDEREKAFRKVFWRLDDADFFECKKKFKEEFEAELWRRLIWDKLKRMPYNTSPIFNDGIAVICEYQYSIPQYYFIDRNGIVCVQGAYDDARNFCDGLAFVKSGVIYEHYSLLSNEIDYDFYGGKWGVINIDGDYIVKPKYDVVGDFIFNVAPFALSGEYTRGDNGWRYQNGKWGLIATDGREIVLPIYDFIKYFRGKYFMTVIAKDSNFMYGIIDVDGVEIVPPAIYESYTDFISWLDANLMT